MVLNYELSLQENGIENIHEDTFVATPDLLTLDLSSNHLSDLNSHAFTGLSILTDLELSHNDFIDMPVEALYSIKTTIERVYFSNNPINKVTSRALEGFDRLEELSLYNCSIHTIDEEAFLGMPTLQTLDLGGNYYLGSIPSSALTSSDLQNLIELRLDHTNMTELDEVTLSSLTKLKILAVNDMKLHCNCDALWMKQIIGNANLQFKIRFFLAR